MGSCIEKAGFTVSVQQLDSNDKDLGVTDKMEVNTPSGLHTIDFWKTAMDATNFAKGGGNYAVFGTITIDDAGTPDAMKIEGCFH